MAPKWKLPGTQYPHSDKTIKKLEIFCAILSLLKEVHKTGDLLSS